MPSFDDTPHFKTPAPWGIGTGPIELHSIGEAIDAAGRRIEEIEDRGNADEERERLQALIRMLDSAVLAAGGADLQTAKLGIKGFVLYMHRRTASREEIRRRLAQDRSDDPSPQRNH